MYKFFLEWKNIKHQKIFITLIYNILKCHLKSFKHFYVSISKIMCTFALPNSRKNEENIPTITQKKSK